MKKICNYIILFSIYIIQCVGSNVVSAGESYPEDKINGAFRTAIYSGQSDKVKELIEAGVDVNQRTLYHSWSVADMDFMEYCTALQYSAMHGHADIIRQLIQANAHIDTDLVTRAATHGHANVLKELFQVSSLADWDAAGALACAAEGNHVEAVKELIQEGADVDHEDKRGNTVLMCAVKNNHLEMVEELIREGADVNHEDKNGNTALLLAISHKASGSIVDILLERTADVSHSNKQGKTALIYAVTNQRVDVVKTLLEIPEMQRASWFGFGTAPINYSDEDGNTALIHAIKETKYTYIQGDRRGYLRCARSQDILSELMQTPGIDFYHANNAGETAIELFERLQDEAGR